MKSKILLSSVYKLTFLAFIILPVTISSQTNEFIGKQLVKDGNMSLYKTTPERNNSIKETFSVHQDYTNQLQKDRYVIGGNILWSTQDAVAIANTAELNADGTIPMTAWGLNNMRVSLYSDLNSTPLWQLSTEPNDPDVALSSDGSVIAVTRGTHFYLLDKVNGNITYEMIMPDSLYATNTSVSRDGNLVVFLAQAIGSATISRAYALDLSGASPTISWMMDVSNSQITNWAGVNISASGSRVVINGRHHIYVLNSADGNLIWNHFVDNTESPAGISGDGSVIVTADNSGFVQTRHFNQTTQQYDMLWQYRIPAGTSTNWASSVNISADGSTIVAGTLIFLPTEPFYDGSVIAFDTYGDGTPKWVYTGAGDLVDDIAISDDGKVAAAVTWGDFIHTKPDLFVFDVQTGELTFEIVSPGSFFTVDISHDGKRVFAGGKAVHAREFGNGGRIYLSEIELGGGHVSGNVNLTNSGDNSGVVVKAQGTTRTAVTDMNGDYLIENIPPGTYTINAEKPGYNFGEVSGVIVSEGNTTTGINFALDPFTTQPPALTASTNIPSAIMLSWSSLLKNIQRENEIAKMIGDDVSRIEYSATSTKVVEKLIDNNTYEFWDSYASGVDSIAVYRSVVSGGPYTKIAGVSGAQNNYTDSSVYALRDYYYIINIFNDVGQSIYSNEAHGRVSDTLLTFAIDAPQASIPTIDGVLSAGEWDDAVKIDVSDIFGYGDGNPVPQGSVFMYFKFDDVTNMLYVAGEDFLNPTLDNNEGFGLYFDDNNNGKFESSPPFIQEGNFWAYWHPGGADLRFRDLVTFEITTLVGAEVAFSDVNGHLQGEVAIPMGFMEGYQLQVFGPDKTPGLGAFIIGRLPDQSAVFNGWWPQTMNTVFNPLYFGDVGIDVSLIAPPQYPSDITVERQGNDLLINWTDPVLGLNNDPLPVSPTINLYKNDEYLMSFSSGTQTFPDDDVACGGWYEYKMNAFIVIGQDTLTGPISPSLGNFACVEPVLTPISYDDGLWDGFYVPSFGWEENKFAVRFTPQSYPAIVRKMETLTNGDNPFDFTIQADSSGLPGKIVAGPYRVQGPNPSGTLSTVVKTIPGLDPPEFRDGDFWVVINWLENSPGAPGIGMDIQFIPPTEYRSYSYLTSTGWVPLSSPTVTFNIMITAYVSDNPVNVEDETGTNLPLTYELRQNYPNPFNPSTIINYQLPSEGMVKLVVYDLLGREVAVLVNEPGTAGYHQVIFDGGNLASGVYMYRLQAGNFTQSRKMILIK